MIHVATLSTNSINKLFSSLYYFSIERFTIIHFSIMRRSKLSEISGANNEKLRKSLFSKKSVFRSNIFLIFFEYLANI